MDQKLTASVPTLFTRSASKAKAEYRVRLGVAVDVVRLLLRQGFAFRGHDESALSNNKGNYLEVFHFLADRSEAVKNVSFENAPQYSQLVAGSSQRDICIAAAKETTLAIIKDIGKSHFTILVDESRDISVREQMAVTLRYVNKEGRIIERFLGIEHVPNTTSAALKKAVDNMFSHHKLSIQTLRGQGYDGASNMQGELKGLKTFILKENPFAFYVNCFAHQLQLSLVAAVKYHSSINYLFEIMLKVMNVVGASCKRKDSLRTKQHDRVMEALISGELVSGSGLNQETDLQRPGDTRWGSHYISLVRLTNMFSSVIDVLRLIIEDGKKSEQRAEARMLLDAIVSFEFVFAMHLMRTILAITNELSLALQRKEQDIENAMRLVQISKQRLQTMRDDGWDSLLIDVSRFCDTHELAVIDMHDQFVAPGRPRCKRTSGKSNMDHFRTYLFYVILDKQLMELNSRFSEASSDLLRYVGCLNPKDSFYSFDKERLINLARLYPLDFSEHDISIFGDQLETFIVEYK